MRPEPARNKEGETGCGRKGQAEAVRGAGNENELLFREVGQDQPVCLNEIDLFQQTLSISSPSLQGLQARSDGAMIIQYDYTPVPLPGAYWLLGSGLLGLGGLEAVQEELTSSSS